MLFVGLTARLPQLCWAFTHEGGLGGTFEPFMRRQRAAQAAGDGHLESEPLQHPKTGIQETVVA